MQKLILFDDTEIQIHDGASLRSIVTDIDGMESLQTLLTNLTNEKLKKIQIISTLEEFPESDTGTEYVNMTLLNNSVSVSRNLKEATFGLRQLTQDEMNEASVLTAISYLTDDQAITVKDLYPNWEPDKLYLLNDRARYEEDLYKCLQQHTSIESWNPKDAPSLWSKILTDPSGEILLWVQPGSTNGYMRGDKVAHNGHTWESDVDNNVWEPGAIGTESLWHIINE